MNRRRHLVVLLCSFALGGMVPAIGLAQSTPAVVPSTSFRGASTNQIKTLSPGDELAATGTIQEVVTTYTPGSPRGVRVILASPQGIIDASVGPYLAADVQQSLAAGESVTVDGVVGTFNGHDYLLVRQMTISDRQVTIRNERGFLVRPPNTHARQNEIVTKGDNQ